MQRYFLALACAQIRCLQLCTQAFAVYSVLCERWVLRNALGFFSSLDKYIWVRDARLYCREPDRPSLPRLSTALALNCSFGSTLSISALGRTTHPPAGRVLHDRPLPIALYKTEGLG